MRQSLRADAARGATMLVLGRDNLSWGERLLMGAVTAQIAESPRMPADRGSQRLASPPGLAAAASGRRTRWRDGGEACAQPGIRGSEHASHSTGRIACGADERLGS